MGDAGDLSDATYIVATTQPNLPNSQLQKHQIISTLVTDNDITNTTAETDLFSYSVPANTLGTANVIRVSMSGTFAANSGTPTVIFRTYYGSTTMHQDTTFSFGAATFTGPWNIMLFLSAHNSASLQELSGHIHFANRGLGATTGNGDLSSTTPSPNHPIEGTATEDSTSGALNFRMTLTWSAAHSSYSWKRKLGILELLKA